jgi:hypothetical protein
MNSKGGGVGGFSLSGNSMHVGSGFGAGPNRGGKGGGQRSRTTQSSTRGMVAAPMQMMSQGLQGSSNMASRGRAAMGPVTDNAPVTTSPRAPSSGRMNTGYSQGGEGAGAPVKKPSRCVRAKGWSREVEDAYRIQQCGWRDIQEYQCTHGEVQRWDDSGFIRCVRVQKNGFFTYWQRERECFDKFVPKVKLYEYE